MLHSWGFVVKGGHLCSANPLNFIALRLIVRGENGILKMDFCSPREIDLKSQEGRLLYGNSKAADRHRGF